MQQLSVIGVEGGSLVLESASGERFNVPVSELPGRRPKPEPIARGTRKTSPRDIQALIRGGMSAEQVAKSTGEDVAFVQRFEGPVLAERAHILQTALSIPVASGDIDPLAGETTFGAAIEERLSDLRATDRSWDARKDSEGGSWTVRLRFTTEGIQHEANWGWEPKKATLTPRGKEATSLSQAGDASSVLVPRLRAIDRQQRPSAPASAAAADGASDSSSDDASAKHEPAPPISQRGSVVPQGARRSSAPSAPERSESTSSPQPAAATGSESAQASTGRFDSDVFRGLERASGTASKANENDAGRAQNPWLGQRSSVGSQPEGVQAAAISRPAANAQPNHTAELLDALRRRRSEREEALRTAERAPETEQEPTLLPSDSPHAERVDQPKATPTSNARKRGGRAAMPSWDDIVFGSKGDEGR